VVVKGKLKIRLKWSWPNRGIIPVFAWRNWEKHEKSWEVSWRSIEIHTRDTKHNPRVVQYSYIKQPSDIHWNVQPTDRANLFSFFLCLLICFLCLIFYVCFLVLHVCFLICVFCVFVLFWTLFLLLYTG
jgi:Flp pilus assembly protein TadB